MSRTVVALATVGRAYLSGRVSTLRPPRPLQLHRIQERLASASPEIAAAYAAGQAADPASQLLEPQAVLAQVVQRMARVGVEEMRDAGTRAALAGTTSGPPRASGPELGQLGPALGGAAP